MTTLELTPDRVMPAWLAQPVHSPERRRFSVLCHRGWCDHEFKVRAVAALTDAVAGPRPDGSLPDLPVRACPIPALCDCECHDGGVATVSSRARRGRWTLLSHEWNGETWRLAWRLDDTTFDLERGTRGGWLLYSNDWESYYQPGRKSLYDAMAAIERWYGEQIMTALAGNGERK